VAELLVHLTAQRAANVVLIGSPVERPHVDAVVRQAGVASRVVNLAGRSSIGELVALLEQAAVFVTNDSGPMHIAAATGTSTVALFGPETPTLYRPLRSSPGQRHFIHYLGMGCSPCMFVHDNKVLSCWFSQAKCMSGIAAADVLASVEAALSGGEIPATPQLKVLPPGPSSPGTRGGRSGAGSQSGSSSASASAPRPPKA
jgi:ADP-heptose:LPS heptosyltransferase